MYYTCKPSKVQIYVNNARKTMAQIKNETGADVIINGGIYNMSTFQPYCWLKVNGQLLAHDQYGYYGYGWNDAKLTMDTTANIARYSNFLACVEIVNGGKLTSPIIYDTAMGGRRGRSAIGVRQDGQVVVWCTQDGAYALTPEQLQVEMINLGCVSSIMLDGGGSCQCVMPTGQITSSRIVQNFLCIWIAKENTAPPQNTQVATCTYGTKAECQYRPPCGYCSKQYKMCPLIGAVT